MSKIISFQKKKIEKFKKGNEYLFELIYSRFLNYIELKSKPTYALLKHGELYYLDVEKENFIINFKNKNFIELLNRKKKFLEENWYESSNLEYSLIFYHNEEYYPIKEVKEIIEDEDDCPF